VVPARGGMGEDWNEQAGSIAAKIAAKLGANYRLLHLPANLGAKAVAAVSREPEIREVLQVARSASVLLLGIGAAQVTVQRQNLDPSQWKQLQQMGAVGETFGCYFNRNGDIVYISSSIGLNLENIKPIGRVIVVAGGSNKAEAILAYCHIIFRLRP